jgi:hypothetical protein
MQGKREDASEEGPKEMRVASKGLREHRPDTLYQ